MKISILSAVMNEATHLPEMIASVQAQTHQDWELIFADDGSSDSTLSIIEAFVVDDSRVKLAYSGENRGKNHAFNRCFEMAEGEVIVLLAGDDTLPPNALSVRQTAMSALVDAGWGATFFKLRTMSESAKHDGLVLPKGVSGSRSGGVITMGYSLAAHIFPLDEALVSEDPWLRLAIEASPGERESHPEVVLNYRIHDGNSNPRNLPYQKMRSSMFKRLQAYESIMGDPRFELSGDQKRQHATHIEAIRLAENEEVLKLLKLNSLGVVERLSYCIIADERLWRLRQRLFRVLSGRRGA